MNPDMSGKICMVTGGTSGLGKVTATELAKMKAQVVIVCRDEKHGNDVKSEIIKSTGNDKIELLIADLSVQKEIHDIAASFKKSHDKLHVLVNNAAVVPFKRMITVDEIEMQFAVNHLAPFLLTHLLLDKIKDSAPARIVNVSSGLHYNVKLDLDNLQGEKSYKPMKHYAVTKLLDIFFTYELAYRIENSGVTVNTLSPGFTSTGLGREFATGSRFAMKLFGKKPEKGAQTQIYLAMSPEVEKISGKYFDNCRQKETSRLSHDKEISKKIWEMSEKMTGLTGYWNL